MSEPAAPQEASQPPSGIGNLLDAILVIGVLLIISGVFIGLFVGNPSATVLPIIASMVSALISAVVAGYAAYRWGASVAMKKAAASDAERG